MMKARMTPGPWHADGTYDERVFQVRHEAQFICKVRNQADARLIAAAPDLLAALRGMVAANVPGHGVPMTDAMREAYITARAAIAKAGEQ